MKKLLILLLSLFACGLALTACDDSGKKNEADHVHEFGEWTTVIEATCIAEGKQERVCECGEKEIQPLAKGGHTEVVDAAVAPSCSSTGLTEGKHCSVCNEVIIAQETVATTGHTYSNATCTAPKTCSCGATEGSALGHTWKNATCTKAKTCSTCLATEGSALGHKWSKATCTTPEKCSTCGKTQGSVTPHNISTKTSKCVDCGAFEYNVTYAARGAVKNTVEWLNSADIESYEILNVYYVNNQSCACYSCKNGDQPGEPYITVIAFYRYLEDDEYKYAADIFGIHKHYDESQDTHYLLSSYDQMYYFYYIGDELTEIYAEDYSFYFDSSNLVLLPKADVLS